MLAIVKDLPKLLKHGGGKLIFKLEKNKPQLMVVTGAVLLTGGFVLAIANARKMDDVMADGEAKVNDIQMRMQEAANPENHLDEKQMKTTLTVLEKDLRKAKADNIVRMAFLMGVPCMIFAGGLCLTIGGHVILFKRFGELSAAFAGLQEVFNRYRQMNIAEHGEECDRRYRYGIVGETEVETTVTDPEGNEQTVKCKVPIVEGNGASLYTFIFSEEFSRKCPKDPVNTISFLRSQEKYWNMWMKATGKPVTLSMVLNDLGVELDPDDPANDYILTAGWRPNGDGDNYIDFGIMRAVNKPAIDMLENVVMLNFNCDGNLYHSTRYTKDGRKVC